jgi:hypothetical protein
MKKTKIVIAGGAFAAHGQTSWLGLVRAQSNPPERASVLCSQIQVTISHNESS